MQAVLIIVCLAPIQLHGRLSRPIDCDGSICSGEDVGVRGRSLLQSIASSRVKSLVHSENESDDNCGPCMPLANAALGSSCPDPVCLVKAFAKEKDALMAKPDGMAKLMGVYACAQQHKCNLDANSAAGREAQSLGLFNGAAPSFLQMPSTATASPKDVKEHAGLMQHLRASGDQMPAGWFNGFSEHESTYTQDALEVSGDNPERAAKFPDKLFPGQHHTEKYGARTRLPEWFEESPSGGPLGAWQTYYPSLDELGNLGTHLDWMYTSDGRWQQVYEPPSSITTATNSLAKPAGWFDTHVMNFDAYGRVNEPAASTRRYMDWEPKLSHVALSCKTAGCIANATLKAYEPGQKAKCYMTFATHPTDFDDDHSEEVYEWILANEATVNTYCKPRATGCGPKAVSKTSLFPCMQRQDISELLSKNNGTLKLAAKISPTVDECPQEDGSLLSGKVEVYCLIQKKKEEKKSPPEPEKKPRGVDQTSKLQCTEPGCIANTTIFFDKLLVKDQICKMSVLINQTDFDKDLSVEQVEWINVGNKTVKANCTPGQNPCKNATDKASVVHDSFECVSGEIVSEDAWTGMVNVSAKISPGVDECASQSFLLDGLVQIICRPNHTLQQTTAAPSAADPAPAPPAADAAPAPTPAPPPAS